MNERLKKELERQTGKRGEWQPNQPTPKQIQDQIRGRRGDSMQQGLAEYPPNEQVKAQKQEGLRRRRHSKKKR